MRKIGSAKLTTINAAAAAIDIGSKMHIGKRANVSALPFKPAVNLGVPLIRQGRASN